MFMNRVVAGATQEPQQGKQAGFSVLLALALALSVFLMAGADVMAQADETYVVQRGDNLTAIAARYGLSVEALARANGIANVNNIYSGQSLKIPKANGSNSNNAPAQPSTGAQAHLVQSGDSLSAIAARYGVTLQELATYNNLSVMSYIYVGQTLRIPPKGAAPATAPVVVAPTPTPVVVMPTSAPQSQAGSYTVQTGDSLSAIAARFNTTVNAIVAANNIANPSSIFAGQKLVIPGPGAAQAPPAAQPVVPTAPLTTSPASDGKWIDVNLSQQRLTAYDGNRAVFSSLVSTGTSRYPTVTGTFNIYVKYSSQAMTGGSGRDYYYLPGVPYVMYFYSAYAIHGTYWHSNFGRQMSHGCVNLPTEAARFMYNWAPIGTPVKVHY